MFLKILEPLGWLYTIVAFLLGIYSVNMLVLTLIFWIRKPLRKPLPAVGLLESSLPVVTVQLPLYNESQVAGRVIETIIKLDYPPDRLQIQVLDDSTDDTLQVVTEKVNYWRNRSRWIELHHRTDRTDYKAGALREGLRTAGGEFIVIFDADFIPSPDWLKKALVPFFQPGGERVGFVQTRWSHLNDNFSLLTRAQALGLDAHFGIEQTVRGSTGLLMSFNGTAGIWRRAALEEAGNWRGDTLAEDLDLSYRAQLCGWKACFLRDVIAPAELPVLMIGFKRQQFRWAKGSIQALKLLGKQILNAPISIWHKIEAFLHLSGYMVHPLMLSLLILTLPLTFKWENVLNRLPLGWIGVVGLGVPFAYITSQMTLYPPRRWWQWFVRMPVLSALGVGIAVNNTGGIIEAFLGKQSAFERTPKIGDIRHIELTEKVIAERLMVSNSTWFELILGVYALIDGILAVKDGNRIGAIFYALYAAGFMWVAGSTLWEARASRAVQLISSVSPESALADDPD